MSDFSQKRFKKQTASDLIEQIARFDGSPGQFLQNILSVQCFLGQVEEGAMLSCAQDSHVNVLAVYPEMKRKRVAPEWLAKSVESVFEAISENNTVVKPLQVSDDPDRQNEKQYILLIPLKMVDMGTVVATFLIRGDDKSTFEIKREKLELTIQLLKISETWFTRGKLQAGLERLRSAMETMLVINRQDNFVSAAMAFCNEAASQWQCERVSIGLLKGRYVEFKAMSHTEDFSRKMDMIQDIESAMEECLDQDVVVVSPVPEGTTYIARATEKLSKRYGPSAVLSLPLRYNGEGVGVMTLERPEEKIFSPSEIETIRLTCELATARLLNLHKNDRWIGARAADKLRENAANLLGPTHTWAKIWAVLGFAVVLFLIFGKGQYRVKSPFILEATYQQVVPAPFDGYITSVDVEVGQSVQANESLLGKLDSSELRLRLAAAKAEKHGYLKQASAYMRDGETAQAQIARANADKTSAEIDLLSYMINQASLISPTSGTVVKGDLKREIGAPVKTGDILFEVAPLDSLRAELLVPEDEIFDVKVGQEGFLATASYPAQRLKFTVERINPMAEVIEQRNVFRVRVRLLEVHTWMRPGMEGVAKVSVGKRRYVWIWTRKIINWIRMKLWL